MTRMREYVPDNAASTLQSCDAKDHTDLIVNTYGCSLQQKPEDAKLLPETATPICGLHHAGHENHVLQLNPGTSHLQNRIYSTKGVSPALTVGNAYGSGVPAFAIDCRHDSLSAELSNPLLSKSKNSGVSLTNVNPIMQEREAGWYENENVIGAHKNSAKRSTFVPKLIHTRHYIVRRLTPMECERLMGFPDGHTRVPLFDLKKGWKATPDAKRYAALGNSMEINVMRWIGTRLKLVHEELKLL